jgi:hypothetical protein
MYHYHHTNRTETTVYDGANYAQLVTLGDGRVRLELGQDHEILTMMICDLDDYDGLEEMRLALEFWCPDTPPELGAILAY